MTAVNDPTHALAATPSRAEGSVERTVMAIALVIVFIAAIVGVAVAISMGHGVAVIGITLIAGGLFCAAGLC